MTDHKTADTVEAPELMPRSDPGPLCTCIQPRKGVAHEPVCPSYASSGPAPMRRTRAEHLDKAGYYLRQAVSECDGTEHPAIGDLFRAVMHLLAVLEPDDPRAPHRADTFYPKHSER